MDQKNKRLTLPGSPASEPISLEESQQAHKPRSINSSAVQDAFLNAARKNLTHLSVFLLGGVKLQGVIGGFDRRSILLKRLGQPQTLVFKHSISSISGSDSFAPFDLSTLAPPEPMRKSSIIQETFLHSATKEAVPLTIFLFNGIKLQGQDCAFDRNCILIERPDKTQTLVYKHAITTITVSAPLKLYDKGEVKGKKATSEES